MYAPLGSFAVRFRFVLVAVLVALLAGGIALGHGVARHLSGGGFAVEGGDAEITTKLLEDRLGAYPADVVVLYAHPSWQVGDPAFDAELDRITRAARAHEGVGQVRAPVDLPALVSADRSEAAVIIGLTGSDEATKIEQYDALQPTLRETTLDTRVGGIIPSRQVAQDLARRDLIRAELIALPLAFALLLWLFRSVVASLVPVVIAAVSISIAMLVLRGLAMVTDVSIFAMNIVSFLGIGLAVDYSLFIVHRFREELQQSPDVTLALRSTASTAGRTVALSGFTVAVSLLGLLWFDVPALESIAVGGAVITVVTVLVAVVLLPALLAVLGRRIEAGRIGKPKPMTAADDSRWFAVANWVMRRSWLVAIGVTIVMLTIAAPARNLEVAPGDASVFPLRTEPRQVADALADPSRFATSQLFPVELVIEDPERSSVDAFVRDLEAIHGVEGVDRVPLEDMEYLRVRHVFSPSSAAGRDLVATIHDHVPPDLEVHATGPDAAGHELHEELLRAAPHAVLTITGIAFIALLVAFRSIALPLKAFLMNLLSVGAGYGALVFVFQQGHLDWLLGHDSPGALDPSIAAVVFAITFGLSLDYEVFILSRVKEEWEATGDNRLAVARGLARTGRLVTGAALLLVAVIVGFLAGEMVFIKQLGVGLGVAILLDATLVRALLVPATMDLLGNANWWVPGKRIGRRIEE
jgi:uncharacterized membrane protein YdfJ with MMPL/SSD domain